MFVNCVVGGFEQSDQSAEESTSHLRLLEIFHQLYNWEADDKNTFYSMQKVRLELKLRYVTFH